MNVLSWIYKTSQSTWIPSENIPAHTTHLASHFYDKRTLRTYEPSFLDHVPLIQKLQLCEACGRLDWERLATQTEPQVHLSNCHDLERTARECKLCASVALRVIERSGLTLTEQLVQEYQILPEMETPMRLSLEGQLLRFHVTRDDDVRPPLDVRLYDGSCAGDLQLAISADLLPAIRLPERAFMRDLRSSMPPCFKFVAETLEETSGGADLPEEPILPPRVLDIAGDETPPTSIRLLVNKSGSRGRFATLSHRWGTTMPYRTTLANIEQRRQCIQVRDLPQTFQDAITVTRLLGIRYLWIDALAIIQDDPADWAEQASLMANIYQKSYVTIAVHTARDASHGFLWPFTSLNTTTLTCRTDPVDSPTREFQILPLADLSSADSTIQNRAWIYQELSLPQRILHFYNDRLGWQCAHPTCLAHEIHPSPFNLMEMFSRRSQHVSHGWQSFVDLYSATQMTKLSDKLAAVAGIAQVWPRRPGSNDALALAPKYYCGIFDDDLALSLAWMRAAGESELFVVKPHRAPRWSWASVDGRTTGQSFYTELLGNGSLENVSFECLSCKPEIPPPHLTCVACCINFTAWVVYAQDVTLQDPDVWLPDVMRTGLDAPQVRGMLRTGDGREVRDKMFVWPRFDCAGLQDGDEAEFRYIVLGTYGSKPRYLVLVTLPSLRGCARVHSRVGIGVATFHDGDDDMFESLARKEEVALI